jgi:hypothetical protein
MDDLDSCEMVYGQFVPVSICNAEGVVCTAAIDVFVTLRPFCPAEVFL